jgi:ribosomal protein L11 methyltransferase
LSLHTITINLPADLDEDQVGLFSEALSEQAISTSALRREDPFNGPWQVQWLVEEKPDFSALITTLSLAGATQGLNIENPVIEPLADVNWLEQSYRQFPPFTVGPFFIYGSHYKDAVPAGLMGLQIDAATAFGSGEHGTTSGCLMLLNQLKECGFKPKSVLDMGCGSGILAVAARKLWNAPVLAIDIDPESIRVTQNHAWANDVEITGVAGDGFAVVDSNHDLIIANILPLPLKSMAGDIVRRTNDGSYIILSGMLLDQADDVLHLYKSFGTRLETRLDRGEWTALLLQK